MSRDYSCFSSSWSARTRLRDTVAEEDTLYNQLPPSSAPTRPKTMAMLRQSEGVLAIPRETYDPFKQEDARVLDITTNA